jgi:magnesium transporter
MKFAYKYLTKNDDIEKFKVDLEKKYKIEELDIEDVFTSTQLSKIEKHNSYTYVALQFPDLNVEEGIFVTKELHLFIGKNFLIIYDKHLFSLMGRFQEKHTHRLTRSKTPFQAFYEILDYLITRMTRAMRKFAVEVDTLEDVLFTKKGTDKDFIFDIQILKRNIINFSSLIGPIEAVFEDLQKNYNRTQKTDKRVQLLDDTLDKIRKMKNNLINFKEQMALISETNEQLIARNTNEVIKVMTAVTILIMVPSLIVGFFGMNIYFGWDPAEVRWFELWLVISIILLAMIGLTVYFKKQKWF